MEKRKVRYTIMVVREYEVDLADYQDMGSKEHPLPPCMTIEEAVQIDVEGIKEDPFMFMDSEDTEFEVKYEILPE